MSLSPSLELHPINYIYTLWDNCGQIARSLLHKSSTAPSIDLDSCPSTTSPLFGVPISYRYLLNRLKTITRELRKPWTLLSITGFALCSYIIYPSIRYRGERNDMHFTKRPDKYTTGFINPSIDCFANSNLQALSSLPTLNVYLNVIETISRVLRQMISSKQSQMSANSQHEVSLPDIRLHEALMKLLGKLQSIIFYPSVISVWNFLHVLEDIHDAHISRNQHDAHELLQLVLETLMKEYTGLKTLYESNPTFATELKKDGVTKFPDFPFGSEVASNFRCMRCGKLSSITYNPMMILSMGLPEESSVALTTLIKRNESEIIEDYSCLVCKVRYIFATKDKLIRDPKKLELIDKLRMLYDHDQILINSDLNPELEAFIEKYPGIDTSGLRSVVHREVSFVKPPQILILHLSRSLYEATHAWRNSCQVKFDMSLILNIDQEKVAKYRQVKNQKHETNSTSSQYSVNNTNTDSHTFTLRSVIRHIGSHSSGHYECYKRKPIYYKRRSTGRYYTREPNIIGFGEDSSEIEGPNMSSNSSRSRNSTNTTSSSSSNILNDASKLESTLDALKRSRNGQDKIVNSSLKKPFWKISDDVIKEVRKSKVLDDGEGVYMLFYDRSDCLYEELL